MNKLASLRASLLAAPLGLKAGDIDTFMADGRMTHYVGPSNHSFKLAYDAEVILTNFTGNPATIGLFIWAWIETNQPGTLPDAVTFEADVLDSGAADIAFKIPLTEDWVSETVPDGTRLSLKAEPIFDPDSLTGFSQTP